MQATKLVLKPDPVLTPVLAIGNQLELLLGKADGTDVLLGNVEFQHRHAAQLNTHANPFVERLVGSIRRECLDHVIVWNERSLRRTLHNYFAYYQWSRTHLALGKDAPESRAVEPPEQGRVVAIPQVGGLHHRYQRRAA